MGRPGWMSGHSGSLPWFLLPLAGAGLLMIAPYLGLNPGWARQVILIAFLSLVVSGLNLSFGYAGELALGQVAMYATGAYVAGYLSEHGANDLLVEVVCGALAALIVGVISGVPGVRLGGWALAMVSFFLVLLIPDIVGLLPSVTGGEQGLFGLPLTKLFGETLDPDQFYLAVLCVTVAWFAFLRNVIVSRHGTVLHVLRQSPVLTASLGIAVYRTKLRTYALGAVPAGVAGALFANLDHFISPETFSFSMALAVLAASVVGGSRSVYGAFIGAALLQLGPLRTASFLQFADLVYGVFLVVIGVLLSGGLAGIARGPARRFARTVEARVRGVANESGATTPTALPSESRPVSAAGPAIPRDSLRVEAVSKMFGGIRALSDVTLEAQAGRVTALIGPNGSGKTTLLNVVCGFYRAERGAVRIGDTNLSGLAPHRVANSGVRRTFQTPNIPAGLTVLEAVIAGRISMSRCGLITTSLRLPRFWKVRSQDIAEAERALRFVGIETYRDLDAASLPLGTRRMLELARALVAQPRLLLLDEIASGLDEQDIARLVDVIRRIRDGGAVVLVVEHNFRLVMGLADEIHVLAEGALIASGPPAEIERNARVAREYLGAADEDPHLAAAAETTAADGQ